ncbi:MAG: Ig-like domain-containing protein [Oscillospiraceae bacterium]|nr:Ig-like domain-containing protein [Oscillospiraceae bacterium]
MKKAIKNILSTILAFVMITSVMTFAVYGENLEEVETIDTETEEVVTEKNIDDAIAGSNNEDNRKVSVPARNIRLKTTQQNKIVIGQTFQIKYSLRPLKSDDYVTYRNFNKKVVKVDENGLVTAIGYGTAKIQIEASSGVKRNIYFTVTDAEGNVQTELVKGDATSIEFVDKYAMVRKGKTTQIEPIFYPLGIYDNVVYKSADTSIATVSENGLITAVKSGSTIIKVTTDDGVSAEVEVTVYNDYFNGIDVSKWQGTIDWKKVANDGIDFVMIRSSYGYEDTDPKLKINVDGCEKYGIDYGFYHYTYARNVSEAKKEAKYFLKTIKKYDPDYPIVMDIEESFYNKMSRKKVTDIVVTFMEELEDAGYYAMIYCSPSFIKDNLDSSRISQYDIWIASWGDEEKLNSYYDGHYGMWQYTDKGSVNGITEDVDLDYAYKDYAAIIDKFGLNK